MAQAQGYQPNYNPSYQSEPYVPSNFTTSHYRPAPLPTGISATSRKQQTPSSSKANKVSSCRDSKTSGGRDSNRSTTNQSKSSGNSQRSSGSEKKKAKKKMANIEEKVGLKLTENSGAGLAEFKDYLVECAICQQGSRFI
jgi:hypothetical protein